MTACGAADHVAADIWHATQKEKILCLIAEMVLNEQILKPSWKLAEYEGSPVK